MMNQELTDGKQTIHEESVRGVHSGPWGHQLQNVQEKILRSAMDHYSQHRNESNE